MARLPPRGAYEPGSVPGAAFATLFLLTAASMGFLVYGPALLRSLADAFALTAGYVIASQSIAWTICSLCVAGPGGKGPARLASLGVVSVATPRDERERGAAGATTVRLTGTAAGVAFASVLAGQPGFAQDQSATKAEAVGLSVFLAAPPLAGLGVISALRLASALAAERALDQSWSRP